MSWSIEVYEAERTASVIRHLVFFASQLLHFLERVNWGVSVDEDETGKKRSFDK